jgi:pyruvate/2-oxoglutarate dehydrogenase complex dihydrolipoamide acyltransferase (E2) component
MPTPIAMPKLGMSMREGRVVSWPVALGGGVEKGQVVVVIESEKAEVEVEATQSGVLRHIYIAVDETVPCGTLLAAITDSGDEAFDADAFRRANDHPEKISAAPAATTRAPARPAVAPVAGGRAPVAPAARALARTLSIDVTAVPGTGPGGRVTKEDVEAFAARRERLVEVAPGVRLEVLHEGEGESILLLPGYGTDVSAFALQTRALVTSHRVLAVNPRGVGLSDAPEEPRYDVATAAADAAAVLSEPAHIVGASLGAAVAIELALRAPERVRSLTLITPFVEASARLRAVVAAWCRVAAESSADALAQMLLPWLFSGGFLESPAVERTRRGLAAACANVPVATLERAAAGLLAWSGSRSGALGLVHSRTLVLAAGADLLTPDAETVGSQIPGAAVTVVAGAGHALSIEAADEVTAAIRTHIGAA